MVHAEAYAPSHQSNDELQLTKDYLPPLDVLMAWHSYVLDTVNFKDDCSKYGKHKALCPRFPLEDYL